MNIGFIFCIIFLLENKATLLSLSFITELLVCGFYVIIYRFNIYSCEHTNTINQVKSEIINKIDVFNQNIDNQLSLLKNDLKRIEEQNSKNLEFWNLEFKNLSLKLNEATGNISKDLLQFKNQENEVASKNLEFWNLEFKNLSLKLNEATGNISKDLLQ
ncbi:MAG: hypothetical protein HY738_07310, partial [Bacteroidia bacterium]|nr:hypothetical protein [Bacteroidia bacterium]